MEQTDNVPHCVLLLHNIVDIHLDIVVTFHDLHVVLDNNDFVLVVKLAVPGDLDLIFVVGIIILHDLVILLGVFGIYIDVVVTFHDRFVVFDNPDLIFVVKLAVLEILISSLFLDLSFMMAFLMTFLAFWLDVEQSDGVCLLDVVLLHLPGLVSLLVPSFGLRTSLQHY